MTIGRILERLEADLRAMTAERDALMDDNGALGLAAAKDVLALAAMTAERDAALKQLALTEDKLLSAAAEREAHEIAKELLAHAAGEFATARAALATCEEERDDWRQKWTELAQRVAAEAAADDFGYFW